MPISCAADLHFLPNICFCFPRKELQRQKIALAEKLKRNREEKMRRLESEQEKERESFVRKADKIIDTGDLVEVRKTNGSFSSFQGDVPHAAGFTLSCPIALHFIRSWTPQGSTFSRHTLADTECPVRSSSTCRRAPSPPPPRGHSSVT